MIIGQSKLKSDFKRLLETNSIPRCLIIGGPKGSGKKTFVRWLATQMNAFIIESDVKADDVRDVIAQSYQIADKTVYIFPDFHRMSNVAQNALLKITEEPPNNAYFLLTTENDAMILNTILSRATFFQMDPYSSKELSEYLTHIGEPNNTDLYLSICDNPGEIDLLKTYDIKAFWDFMNLVLDNIATTSGANAFRIGDKINLSNADDKYDLKLFWKAFITLCMQHIKESPFKYSAGVRFTGRYLRELSINGLNKQMCFDNWLLAIREEWLAYAND